MALEWLRRRDPALDAQLRKFLFTTEPITEVGSTDGGAGTDGDGAGPGGPGSLGIGSLKGVER